MLCPEVWDFRAPQHSFKVDKSDRLTKTVTNVIDNHYFNHSISIVLPDTNNLPISTFQIFDQDSDYYRIDDLSAAELVDKEFIEAFVKKGETNLLAIESRIDVDNSLALAPSGELIISLNKEDFEGLGIEGRPSYFDRKLKSRFGEFRGVIKKGMILSR